MANDNMIVFYLANFALDLVLVVLSRVIDENSFIGQGILSSLYSLVLCNYIEHNKPYGKKLVNNNKYMIVNFLLYIVMAGVWIVSYFYIYMDHEENLDKQQLLNFVFSSIKTFITYLLFALMSLVKFFFSGGIETPMFSDYYLVFIFYTIVLSWLPIYEGTITITLSFFYFSLNSLFKDSILCLKTKNDDSELNHKIILLKILLIFSTGILFLISGFCLALNLLDENYVKMLTTFWIMEEEESLKLYILNYSSTKLILILVFVLVYIPWFLLILIGKNLYNSIYNPLEEFEDVANELYPDGNSEFQLKDVLPENPEKTIKQRKKRTEEELENIGNNILNDPRDRYPNLDLRLNIREDNRIPSGKTRINRRTSARNGVDSDNLEINNAELGKRSSRDRE